MNLRPYQQRSIDALYHWWVAHPGTHQNPICVLPTGAGKSVVIAELCRLLFDTWPEEHPRTVVLVPSKELAEQNAAKLRAMLPTHLTVGYYSAALGRKHAMADVIVATIGSIYKDAHLLGNIKCVVIDECFTGETIVATPSGDKRIDEIRPGDMVYTATGVAPVEAVSRKTVHHILTVRISDGTEIRTTDNHPFFTPSGWQSAGELARGDGLVRLQDMPALWSGISTMAKTGRKREFESASQGIIREGKVLLKVLLEESRERHVGAWSKGEDDGNNPEDQAQAIATWWKRTRNDGASEGALFDIEQWLGSRACNQNELAKGERISDELQGGHRERSSENCHRTGWRIALREAQATGREERRDIDFAWVESVSRKELSSGEFVFNLQVGGHPSYYAGGVLVHNCHMVNPDGAEAGRYRKFLTELARLCSFRVVGYTATPFRGNGVWLTDGEDPLFTGVACTVPVQELLDAGHLAPLIRPVDAMQTRIDTSGIKTTSGDYNLHDLADRVEAYLPQAAQEAVQLAADRKKWIAFCATVENAAHLVQLLNGLGTSAALVCGETPATEREELIASFRAGRIRCLVTVLALATGFDVPDVDCILWLRPTQSPVLYVQGAGRGLRPADRKENCLWLDFSDTTERLGPVDAIKGRKRGKRKAEDAAAPFKVCDQCGERAPAAAPICPTCGYEFPREEKEFRSASNAAIMTSQIAPKINTYPVTRVEYAVHKKEGSPDSMRVDYYSGLRRVCSEWVCIEHTGFAGEKARNWWINRKGKYTNVARNGQLLEKPTLEMPPTSAAQAVKEASHGAKTPAAITVNETGKYPELVRHHWESLNEPA